MGVQGMTAATSYTELIVGIQARLGELGIRYEDFDELAGFAPGLSGKVFGPAQVKRLGPEKLFDALRAASLKLKVEPDPEQLEKMRKQMAEKCQTRQANQARPQNQASPVSSALLSRCFKHLSRKGNQKRWKRVSKKDRSEHARMMGMASGKKRRKIAKRRARQRVAAHEEGGNMKREELIELIAREFCDRMWEVSCDGRRSRWITLQGWQKDRYREAASKVLETLSDLLVPVMPQGERDQRAVSFDEACRRLAVGPETLKRLAAERQVEFYFEGQCWRFSVDSLNAYVHRKLRRRDGSPA
jgi:excisionase family DNA binding protein